jgi:hypothetical protein
LIELQLRMPGAGVTFWNVWDLPLWLWRSYALVLDHMNTKEG